MKKNENIRNNIKIVIIDDEEDILYTIKEICSFGGYEALTATSGRKGYELCKQYRPQLVIVDYHMSDWDGLNTVKKIRALDPAISILVLTVDERQEISDRFIEVGATDFAIKPIKAPDLISRINVNIKIHEVTKKNIDDQANVFVEKGISPATLSLICDFLSKQEDGVTIEEITIGMNLAYQTVHRYVQYLMEQEKLELIPIYGQIGRPKNKYRII
ncbi:response regulator [Tepidibacter formicigenes]|uniref:Stage 0 sporulation protein A homolog n=1 Tax=Tepidibacter formicigenes DSM 15518 TaxID=1123349 RepID=A0A1M6M410_9FIRM|nr:response regulator [Tepidibacter formicigenes]SHJ78167.1 two-component system, CitB family, response regulator DctR [Tepidibacter formicigenes DSM 15518]